MKRQNNFANKETLPSVFLYASPKDLSWKPPCRFGLIPGFLLLIATCCAAENSETGIVVIRGLNLSCPNCTTTLEPVCEVKMNNGQEVLGCDAALIRLLQETLRVRPIPADDRSKESASRNSIDKNPSAAELRRYLLSNEPAKESIPFVLSLLMTTESGQRALALEAPTLALKYQPELTELFLGGTVPSDALLRYWKLPATEGVSLPAKMRAAIIAHHPTMGAKELLEDLSGTDVTKDENELAIFAETLVGDKPEVSQTMRQAAAMLRPCVERTGAGEGASGCSDAELAALPAAAREYLRRAQMTMFLAGIEIHKDLPSKILAGLRRTDFRNLRTPKLHELVLSLIDKATAASPEERALVLHDANHEVFQVFSQNDKRIAFNYAQLLVRAVAEQWDSRNYDNAFELLDRSFDIYPDRVTARVKLVDQLADSVELRAKPELLSRLTQILKKSKEPVSTESSSWAHAVLIVLVLGTGIAWVFFVFAFLKRRKSADYYDYTSGGTEEGSEDELIELCNFFGIRAEEGEFELTKSFHRMAKESHPDVSEGGELEFRTLSEKYHRAKQLLASSRPPRSSGSGPSRRG